MNATAKPERQRKGPSKVPAPKGGASPQARRQAAAILEVLAGMRRPCEAAHVLGISLPRYYQVERRAVQGLVTACEPVPRGRQQNAGRQLARLEREKQRLQRECDRQQAEGDARARMADIEKLPARAASGAIAAAALSFMVQEPSGIMPRARE